MVDLLLIDTVKPEVKYREQSRGKSTRLPTS